MRYHAQVLAFAHRYAGGRRHRCRRAIASTSSGLTGSNARWSSTLPPPASPGVETLAAISGISAGEYASIWFSVCRCWNICKSRQSSVANFCKPAGR